MQCILNSIRTRLWILASVWGVFHLFLAAQKTSVIISLTIYTFIVSFSPFLTMHHILFLWGLHNLPLILSYNIVSQHSQSFKFNFNLHIYTGSLRGTNNKRCCSALIEPSPSTVPSHQYCKHSLWRRLAGLTGFQPRREKTSGWVWAGIFFCIFMLHYLFLANRVSFSHKWQYTNSLQCKYI